jgi:hypothetical protein
MAIYSASRCAPDKTLFQKFGGATFPTSSRRRLGTRRLAMSEVKRSRKPHWDGVKFVFRDHRRAKNGNAADPKTPKQVLAQYPALRSGLEQLKGPARV